MSVNAGRGISHARLTRLMELKESANRSGLFKTADSLAAIHKELIHFKSVGPEGIGSVLKRVEAVAEDLDEEHSDVALARGMDGKARRGLVASIGIIAVQIFNFATMLLPTEFLRMVASMTADNAKLAHYVAAGAIFALGLVPLRDFLAVMRFDKAKEDVESTLSDLSKDLTAMLGERGINKEKKDD